MTDQNANPTPSNAAPALGETTARGFAWLTAQSVGTKFVNTGGQIVLAWLLLEKDFGLIGVAYTVTAFTSLLEQLGIGQILVQRQAHFRRWVTPAFWMSMTTGLLSAMILVIAAPLAARVYGNPGVAGLLYVLAIASPINTLSIVPRAKLQNDLRFSLIAKVGWVEAAVQMYLSIQLAYLGFGAYAFAIPRPVAILVRVIIMWWAAKPPVRFNLQFRRWRFLVTDSALLLGALVCYTAIFQGDRIVLGIMYDEDLVGLYQFAFFLSMQTVTLFAINLVNVLFPVLSKMRADPVRQVDAYLRATRVLAIVAIPGCMLQAGLADSVVRLVFDPKWEPAIFALQILSLGMTLRTVGWASTSLIQAQGRFLVRFVMSLIAAVAFFILVYFGARTGGVNGTAVAVAIFATVIGPVNIYVASRPGGRGWMDVFHIFLGPTLISAAVIGSGLLVAMLLPQAMPLRDLARLALVILWSGFLYVPIISRVCPEAFNEIAERAPFLKRFAGRSGTSRSASAETGAD